MRADGRVIATPYAKKLAKEMGIDLASIGGSGPNGRITASDVESAKNGGLLLMQRPTACTSTSLALYEVVPVELKWSRGDYQCPACP